MSLTDKAPKNFYKDLCYIENSNNGFDANIDKIRSGNGTQSALGISTNNVKIQPSSDNTTVLNVVDLDGNSLFVVDSTNDTVKAGVGQNHVNTQYANFGDNFVYTASFLANNHYPIGFDSQQRSTPSGDIVSLGTGTNPDTSATISDNAHEYIGRFWYVPDDIVIDSAYFWVAADAASGDTIRCHLMSYDIVTATGATGGDLSNGVVLADGADISSDGYEQAYYQQMTIQSSSVSAGKAIFFTFRQDGTNSDYSISATIKYHNK